MVTGLINLKIVARYHLWDTSCPIVRLVIVLLMSWVLTNQWFILHSLVREVDDSNVCLTLALKVHAIHKIAEHRRAMRHYDVLRIGVVSICIGGVSICIGGVSTENHYGKYCYPKPRATHMCSSSFWNAGHLYVKVLSSLYY